MQFRVKATRVGPGKRVAVVGSFSDSGDWEVHRALPMTHKLGSIWTTNVKIRKNEIPFEYKYVITDDNAAEVHFLPSLLHADSIN